MKLVTALLVLVVAVGCDDGKDSDPRDTSGLEARIASLETSVSEFKTEQTSIIARVAALEAVSPIDPSVLDALGSRITALETATSTLESSFSSSSAAISSADALSAYLSVDAGTDTVTLAGANFRIVNGMGDTYSPNGLGNLFIGYSSDVREFGVCGAGSDAGAVCIQDSGCDGVCDLGLPFALSGSHNVVVGDGHTTSACGGVLAGLDGTASADNAVALGVFNTVSGAGATVTGGFENVASGANASVAGGEQGVASGLRSVVSGGDENTASGQYSAVSGGATNTATGSVSVVSGGFDNSATVNASHLP